MKLFKIIAATVSMLFVALCLYSQPGQRYIDVQVAPENTDWIYGQGEKVRFNVTVLKNNIPLGDIEVRYEISEDMMPARKTGTAVLKRGPEPWMQGRWISRVSCVAT